MGRLLLEFNLPFRYVLPFVAHVLWYAQKHLSTKTMLINIVDLQVISIISRNEVFIEFFLATRLVRTQIDNNFKN